MEIAIAREGSFKIKSKNTVFIINPDGKISFDFAEDSQSIAVLSTASLAKNKEIEDQTAVVVLLQDGKTDLSGISLSGVLIVVGPKDLLPQDSNIKKLDKINLKKVEEYKGSIVHLSK